MATARLDMRLDTDIKSKAEKASAILGYKSLTEYVVKLIDKNASEVITKHENLVLEDDLFDAFWRACDKAAKPNKALLEAVNYTKQQGY